MPEKLRKKITWSC